MKNQKGRDRKKSKNRNGLDAGESRHPGILAGYTTLDPGACPGRRSGVRRGDDFLRAHQKGFTLIELLIVISIIGIMMTVTLPISFDMYARYKASLTAQEVMVAIADLRRESFLYSEKKVLLSDRDTMTVNGEARIFADTRVRIASPIEFYRNGTTTGGVINLRVGEYAFDLHVKAPLGDMNLEGGVRAI